MYGTRVRVRVRILVIPYISKKQGMTCPISFAKVELFCESKKRLNKMSKQAIQKLLKCLFSVFKRRRKSRKDRKDHILGPSPLRYHAPSRSFHALSGRHHAVRLTALYH